MDSRIIKLIAEIDEFKGFWAGMNRLTADDLTSLRILATIESIGSSTRIEGASLSDREVEALLKGIDTRSFRSRDEQEVAGYADSMQLIHGSYSDIELTENNIKQLHKILLKHSEKDQWHLGEYKKHPNHVAAFDQFGEEIGIIFKTTRPFDTPFEMKTLIESIQKRTKEDNEHRLIVISDFIVRFLAIHPFQDGNGRLSRILTNLLLLRAGYEFVLYSSHERFVEANKEHYYICLREAQKSLKELKRVFPVWTEFFLDMLKKQKDLLSSKIERMRQIQPLPKLSQDILNMIKEHGQLSVSFLSKALDANRNTVKRHLQQLTKTNKIVLHGKGRGAFYTFPKP